MCLAATACLGNSAALLAPNPLQSLLDLVEAHVLAPLRVSSLRIDGGVDAQERFRRVQRFNADPTIGAMLLTTQVGGGMRGRGEGLPGCCAAGDEGG